MACRSLPILIGVLLMAGVAVAVGLTATSQQLIAEWRSVPGRVVEALESGVGQFITEAESSIKVNELSGRAGAGAGGNTPVGLRSGELRRAVTGVQDEPLGGFVGTTQGTTTPYARSILGPGQTTITPKSANHLWVPVADNLNPSKIARYTPRGLFETFGDRVKIFKSKKGNLVVFVEDPRNEDGSQARYQRNVYGNGQRQTRLAGDLKGKLMFVLKDQVVIYGTDALALGVQRMGSRGAEILTAKLQSAFPGAGAGGDA